MAEVIWAEPALNDLDAIADYIALDNPEAARRLVQKIFEHVDHLESHPKLGSRPQELKGWRYRQIIEPPCRIFYREDRQTCDNTTAKLAVIGGNRWTPWRLQATQYELLKVGNRRPSMR